MVLLLLSVINKVSVQNIFAPSIHDIEGDTLMINRSDLPNGFYSLSKLQENLVGADIEIMVRS